MTPQPTLFTALEARDAAIERVREGASHDWRTRALAAIRRLCSERETFLCDEVWRYVEKPREARALGAVMADAARAGLCERTGEYRPSAQPQCHANPRMVWRSLVR